MNEVQRERCLAADSDILLGNSLLIKAFQRDPQTGHFLPCRKCRRDYSEDTVCELHRSFRKLYEALMEIKTLLARPVEEGG